MIGADGTGLVHGSSVAFARSEGAVGVLITGHSGTGKSELALELMTLGARLIADDQTHLQREGGVIWLSCPAPIRGLIEIRGMGLLPAMPVAQAPLRVIVDLDRRESERLPPPRWHDVDGIAIRLFRNCASRAFAMAIRQYVLHCDWNDLEGRPV